MKWEKETWNLLPWTLYMYFWFPSPTLPEVTLRKHKQNKKLTERLDDYEGYRVMSVYDYKCYQFWKIETSAYIKHVFIWQTQDQLYLSKFSESCMQKQLFIHKMDISEKRKFSVSFFLFTHYHWNRRCFYLKVTIVTPLEIGR